MTTLIYSVVIRLGESIEDGITVVPVSSEEEVKNLILELKETIEFEEYEVLVSNLDPHLIRNENETIH